MQSGWSGYGVPEIQQFIMENSCSSFLTMSHEMHGASLEESQNQLHHPSSRRFHQLNPIPVTQQLFQPHQFNPVQHFLSANYSVGANESRCSRDGGQETMLACHGSESRHVQREEESAIKEPFWKPLDVEYINKNNKRCKENLEISNKFCKKDESKENEEGKSTDNNYGLYSELEAIYTRSSGGPGGNHQAGSGSALTGDNGPSNMAFEGPGDGPRSGIDHESETSTGEEASLQKLQKSRKRDKRKQQLSSIAAFFQSLVKQLMDHQEALHRKFMEAMERRDQERTDREEAWRRQEAAKSTREATARAEEHALASSREAAIVSLLEKITGERIHLPTKPKFHVFTSQVGEDFPKEERQLEEFNNNNVNINDSNNTRRWPKDEVHALIRVRSGFESRFSEPGLKAPLWEEVSSLMAALGYQRSAKRCKEKWENINKYFRKTKDSAKKRPQHSKTCPYFHQLDQLYSKTQNSTSAALNLSPLSPSRNNENSELLDSIVLPSDHRNLQNSSHEFVQDQLQLGRNFKFPEMGSFQLEFNGYKDNFNEASELNARQVLLQLQREQDDEEEDQEAENEEEEEEEEEEDEEEGYEGEREDKENEQNQGDHPQREHDFYP